ncbi:MAG TPA: NADH-quinone oxidoreductase subunit L [Bacteroidales bacterium]|nr:NADH-quinone oxidoreductase subunit L [Bacteroidales bacterium]HRZ48718.1 NADH-quinone oxidoreductase subunit L [Bacteroidales bacterium]
MMRYLWLVPVMPLLGFLVLAFFGRNLRKSIITLIGTGTVGLSALLVILIGIEFLTSPPAGNAFTLKLWTWMSSGGLSPSIAFYLDGLSLAFIFVVTFVGFLIHVYSSEYMRDDEGFARFLAFMNLFVSAMLILVLADNLALMYLGWEGVGLCSFLLIGFWYKESANAAAARKAFIVTRVGDTAMALGLFLLITEFNTLDIRSILETAPAHWTPGSAKVVWIAFLLLGGAVGKSAQLPLQTWLPDAMAGPSPVSALIHAATMVTAGVYLIARNHVVFELAPIAMKTVAIVGASTLLIAGFAAVVQYDIKRVLAYSTISQIGYMFLALGVGAWSAGIFHFMIHAFFKALLFLGAGAVIHALHHEQNIFKMGGLRKEMPVIFWTFLAGSGALAALPLVTAGFYSKDAILWYSWSSEKGSLFLWAAAFLGAFITSIYTFRMVFITFWGKMKTHIHLRPGRAMLIPLVVLAVLSIIGGFLETPHNLGHITLFSGMLSGVLPEVHILHSGAESTELILQVLTALTGFFGIYLAWHFWMKKPGFLFRLKQTRAGAALHHWWLTGWGFDWVYDLLIIRPFTWLSNINKNDIVDYISIAPSNLVVWLHNLTRRSQNGNLRWYAAGIALGLIITLTIALFL